MNSYIIKVIGENKEIGNSIDELVGPADSYSECEAWLEKNGFVHQHGRRYKRDSRSFVHCFHENGDPLVGSPLADALFARIDRIRSFNTVSVRDSHELRARDS